MGFKVPAFLIIRSNLIGMVLNSSAVHPFLFPIRPAWNVNVMTLGRAVMR